MKLPIKIRKWIGSWFGVYCPLCGEKEQEYGYNFQTRCNNPECETAYSDEMICKECGDKLTLPDEKKYGICRGCASEFITRRYF